MPGRFGAPEPALHWRVRAGFCPPAFSALAGSRLPRPRCGGEQAARRERTAFAAILEQTSRACGQRAGLPPPRRGVARGGEGRSWSGPHSRTSSEPHSVPTGRGVSASKQQKTALPRGRANAWRFTAAKGVEGRGNLHLPEVAPS